MTTSQAPVVWIKLYFGPCGYCGKYASDCQFCKHGDNDWCTVVNAVVF